MNIDCEGDGYYLFKQENKPPKQVRQMIEKYGNWQIRDMYICRTPIVGIIFKILNIVSFGTAEKYLKNKDYDNLYHLYSIVTIESNFKIVYLLIEKNEVVKIQEVKSSYMNDQLQKAGTICVKINFPQYLTLGKLGEQAIQYNEKNSDKQFWVYNAKNNNCQVFILNLIHGNNLKCADCGSDKDLIKFVKQDVDDLLIRPIWGLVNEITDAASAFNRILYGV